MAFNNFTAPLQYPAPSPAALKLQFVGQKIADVPAPATIIDVAVARRNCALMLETAEKLGLGFRAHIKTHKTTELSKLQVGDDALSVKLVASTLAEIEGLLPWLLECKSQSKEISILYGLPLSPSAIPRLAAVSRLLGPGTVGVFADHPAHIKYLDQVEETTWPGQIPVFVNVDIGYHREGVAADSKQLAEIGYALAASQRAHLGGMYTHFGSSYGVSSPAEALRDLGIELEGLKKGAVEFLKCSSMPDAKNGQASKVVLSIGASPTATAAQNITENTKGAEEYRALIQSISESFDVELHAGVYPLMDMQQLATRARPETSVADPTKTLLTFKDLGVRTLVEVASVYPDRGEKPEALIAGGIIVMGREPCKSYPGWGVVSAWPHASGQVYDPEGSKTGWIIGRVSQEHGNLVWEGPRDKLRELTIGEKLLVWPNHACIAGVNFGYYLVVDSDGADGDQIVDVWVRFRGW
ncbi:hypothetical protein R9X50_00074500 [Acrodontium crateriforme]|uniref:D-serine dehydratase-like domain-containing protein n=1 Tax=Acrodontium crateriforme TaxID=150365 RepID=A0AAQ3LYE7_9PEZI|nr:hypothetical protein R9X50_00074500 [Acrodontium crateriforme]